MVQQNSISSKQFDTDKKGWRVVKDPWKAAGGDDGICLGK